MNASLSYESTGWKSWIQSHELVFTAPAGTSRGTLTTKPVTYLFLRDRATGTTGIGECSTLKGLSPEHGAGYQQVLQQLAETFNNGQQSPESAYQAFRGWPSIQFGLEQAFYDWFQGGRRLLFNSSFTQSSWGIPINGLIWMNDITTMQKAAEAKIHEGFRCLKFKIGARNWDDELALLSRLREQYPAGQLELRVDANGAFKADQAHKQLQQLSELAIHSIEQPLPAGEYQAMARLCKQAPLPVALDEALINHYSTTEKETLLDHLRPGYIVLKPSLVGGFRHANEWIQLAADKGIGWWVTSALESNIGLNAIAQWTATYPVKRYHGLGTGGLYTNNIPAPMFIADGYLFHDPHENWDLSVLK